MSHLPKTTCCRSTPRCASCPVRLALEARARQRWAPRAALVDEVFRGAPAAVPPAVELALASLAEARAAARREPARPMI